MIFEMLKIFFISILSFNSVYALQTNTIRKNVEQYTFALIPKLTTNPFFSVAHEGCLDKAKELGNVECLYIGPEVEDPEAQNSIVHQNAR